ncbi:MAG: GAF domain-containing sensor histidine kinase [Chloroflexi bacterium]|nr:GAF domain-containing sensor histidine kinase [Chloroflexota bacterium]OJV92008.1 MAG: hypothetical protein BGO39_12960 [Chloroflexi bacterium 54-19]
MNDHNNIEPPKQDFRQLQIRLEASEREQARWQALALENQQNLEAERKARQEAERTLQNTGFLARASAFVTGAFDYSTNLRELVRLVVNEFADWSSVDLLNDERNKLRREAVASKNPAHEELLRDTYNYYPLNLDGPHPIAQAIREKKSHLVKNAGQIAFSEELNLPTLSREAINSPVKQSYLVVPLLPGSEVMGVFIFVRLHGQKPFDEADLALAEDLASKVALMIQNSRLYERLEEALENQQELNYYKDLYLSILSHELRNPLASIRGYTEVVWRRLLTKQKNGLATYGNNDTNFDFEKEFRSLSIMISQSDRMNRMVNELLDFSKIQKNNFELNYLTTVDLLELVRKILDEQAMVVKTHYFDITADQTDIKGIFDQSRLEQVFNNLITNAIKYSPNGTTVKITLTLQPNESVLEDAPDYVLIAIQDQGQGIAKEALEKLFEKYYRVRTEKNRMVQGLGLGLYICKEIVRQHHGELWVESELDKGSTFYISLPLKPPRSAT